MRWKRAPYFLSVIINRDTCSCRVVKSLLFGHFLYPRCNHAQGQLCPTSKRGATARIYYGMSLKQTTYSQITFTMQVNMYLFLLHVYVYGIGY